MGIAGWLEESTPDRREVTVCFDRRLVSALIRAQEDLKFAQGAGDGMLEKAPELGALEDDVAELSAQVRARSRTLAFEGIGWGRWRDLIAKNPPDVDQAATFARATQLGYMPHAVENLVYNAATFIPAAIAASCADPGMTVDEATRLLDTLPPGIVERIWTAVLDANLAGASDPFVGPA